MTLGNAAAARVRLICGAGNTAIRVEPDPAEMASRYGAETTAPDWRERLVWSKGRSREIDMVVTGTERRRASGSNKPAVFPCEVAVGEMFASHIPKAQDSIANGRECPLLG